MCSARFPLYVKQMDYRRLREQQVRRLMADNLSGRLVADTYTLLVDNKLFFLIFIFKRYNYALQNSPGLPYELWNYIGEDLIALLSVR
jgi:hypothetical protein